MYLIQCNILKLFSSLIFLPVSPHAAHSIMAASKQPPVLSTSSTRSLTSGYNLLHTRQCSDLTPSVSLAGSPYVSLSNSCHAWCSPRVYSTSSLTSSLVLSPWRHLQFLQCQDLRSLELHHWGQHQWMVWTSLSHQNAVFLLVNTKD